MERADIVSARVLARSTGSRVEVTSMRSETETTWVNPDGTFTTDVAAGPIRVRTDNGLVPLDLSLKRVGDRLRPVAAPTQVSFSTGGRGPITTQSHNGRSLSLGWSGVLPEPIVDGGVAMYPNVLPGADLELAATSFGFTERLYVRSRPSVAPVVRFPVTGKGLALAKGHGGDIFVKDAKGAVVAHAPAPRMWDASVDPRSGDHLRAVDIPTEIVQTPSGAELVLSPPQSFFDDPAVTYPVTVDPSISLSNTSDTWVQNDYSSSQISDPWLKVGTYDGGAHVARSMIKWNTGSITGKHVLSATMSLYEHWSYSCTASSMSMGPLGSAFSSTTVWSNQPNYTGTYGTSASFAKGYSSSCPDGRQSLNILNMVDAWADGAITNHGMKLWGTNEGDSNSWKKFCSGNVSASSADAPCTTSANVPTMSVTYNSYPALPTLVGPASASYTNDTTPTFSVKVSDADGGTLKGVFYLQDQTTGGTWVANAASGSTVSSGATSTYTRATALLDGHTYQWRSRAYDNTDYGSYAPSTSTWWTVTVDTTAPLSPIVSSLQYPAGTWTPRTATGSATFSWTKPSSDIVSYLYGLDTNPPTTSTTASSVTLSPTNGYHHLYVRSKDRAGNLSPVTDYAFGVGTANVDSPVDQDRTSTTVRLHATAPPGPTTAKFQYRVGASGTFADIPTSSSGTPVVTDDDASGATATWPVAVVNNGTAGVSTHNFTWHVPRTVTSDGVVQVRVAFIDATSAVSYSSPVSITLDRLGTGVDFATRDIGPGSVGLQSGNLSVSATDVAISGYRGGLGLSRTFNSLTPSAPSIFGPGWTSSLSALGTASAYQNVIDASSYATVTNADGSTYSFTAGTTTNGVTTYMPQGPAVPTGLTLTKTASPALFTLTDIAATQTVFTPDPTSTTRYLANRVVQPGSGKSTSYVYDATTGKVTRILAPNPSVAAGTATETACADVTTAPATWTTGQSSSWAPGCRALFVTYGANGNVSKVTLATVTGTGTTADPFTLVQRDVAQYAYDAANRLVEAWDPRISPALKTRYTYDSLGRLASATPPGVAGWTFAYSGTGADNGKLRSATRAHLNGSEPATTTVVYGVPVVADASCATCRPDLTAATVAGWSQTDLPVSGVAVFPPNHVPTLPVSDYTYADLAYFDANGREVNTAQYGNGWRIETTEYDAYGNVVRELTAANRATALASTDPAGTAAVSRQLDTQNVYSADGVDLIDTYGPAHEVTTTALGPVTARAHAHYAYDQNKPDASTYHLLTTVIVTASVGAGVPGSSDVDARTTTQKYSVGTDTSGWTLRRPLQTVTDPSGLNLVRTTLFNTDPNLYGGEPLEVESRMPGYNGTASAHATRTVYYTAGTNTADAACGGQPQWANLVCKTMPAAQPGTAGLPDIPVTTYTYDHLMNQVTRTDTSGSHTRTWTSSYDTAGRKTAESVSATVGEPVPTSYTCYSSTTGLVVSVRTTACGTVDSAAVETTYDDKGRQTSYRDADGSTTSRTYDVADRLASTSDERGTVTLSYDGGTERRGRLTGITDSAVGSFSATYDADGRLATATLPNGLVATWGVNEVGTATSLEYVPAAGGDPWLADRVDVNIHDEWAARSVEAGSGSQQVMGYDAAGRVSSVTDTAAAQCAIRRYGYDADSNRTSLTTVAPLADGTCDTAGAGSTVTSTYDAADRLYDAATGITYDAFGRGTGLPGAATSDGSGAALASAYYANDKLAGQQQNGRSITWTLDATRRDRSWTDSADGETRTNHYACSCDRPSWIAENAAATAWTRYVTGIDGRLGAVVPSTGPARLALVNLHGDVAGFTTTSPADLAPLATFDYTEFGTLRAGSADPGRYGWLGGWARSADALGGELLMGARSYQPGLGRFRSVDPVVGGSANAYDYAAQNPYTNVDLTGTRNRNRNGRDCGWVTCTIYMNRYNAGRVAALYNVGAAAFAVCTAIAVAISAGTGVIVCGIIGAVLWLIAAWIDYLLTAYPCCGVKIKYVKPLGPFLYIWTQA